MTGDADGRSRDREAFVAMLLGVVGGGHRLRAGIDAALAVAIPARTRRSLDGPDYALLGLLGFCSRLQHLLGDVAPERGPSVDATVGARAGDAALDGLLR